MIVDVGLLPQRPLGEVGDLSALAEELGFGGVWMADSQSVFRDALMALALAAVRTRKVLLGTAVTNPITRHPAVIAGAFASLEELAPGRVRIGLGSGESALYAIGLQPARLARLEEAAQALRSLVRGEPAVWQGATTRLSWASRPIPVYLAASGPRALQLAGRIADGVIFQVGAEAALVEYALRYLRQGAQQAGRNPGEIEVCMRLGCSVHEDRAVARKRAKPYGAVAAKTVARCVPGEELPPQLREELAKLEQCYDYLQHADPAARHQDAVTDSMLDSMTIAGTPAEVALRLAGLRDLGLDRLIIPVTEPDPYRSLHLLAQALP